MESAILNIFLIRVLQQARTSKLPLHILLLFEPTSLTLSDRIRQLSAIPGALITR